MKHTSELTRNRSVVRAFALLRALDDGNGGQSASALARASAIPQPTAARLLATLGDLGIVERDPDGRFFLGRELARLGRAADPGLLLARLSHPLLVRLAEETREAVTLTLPRHPLGAVVVAQVNAPHLIGAADWVGRPFPLHPSGAGKLILAELNDDELDAYLRDYPLEACTPRTIVDPDELRSELGRVRKVRYATTIDELEDGFTAVTAPVRDARDALAAVVGVSGPTFRLGPTRRGEILPPLLACAKQLSELVAGAPTAA